MPSPLKKANIEGTLNLALWICLAWASPAFASGMDGIANAGAIIIGIGAAFIVTMIIGPLAKDELSHHFLKHEIGALAAFGITFLEWLSMLSVPLLIENLRLDHPSLWVFVIPAFLLPLGVNLLLPYLPAEKNSLVPFSKRLFYALGATFFTAGVGMSVIWYVATKALR